MPCGYEAGAEQPDRVTRHSIVGKRNTGIKQASRKVFRSVPGRVDTPALDDTPPARNWLELLASANLWGRNLDAEVGDRSCRRVDGRTRGRLPVGMARRVAEADGPSMVDVSGVIARPIRSPLDRHRSPLAAPKESELPTPRSLVGVHFVRIVLYWEVVSEIQLNSVALITTCLNCRSNRMDRSPRWRLRGSPQCNAHHG